MFRVRALTAAALLVAFLAALLLLDRSGFAVVVGAIVMAGAREWGALAGLAGRRTLAYAAGCAFLYGAFARWWWPLEATAMPVLAMLAAAVAFWVGLVPVWIARGTPRRLLPAAGVAVLLPAAFAMAALPRGMLLALLGLVWLADTAAYLAGRALGRHKLAPAVSPGKTWEGVAGAALVSVAYAIILAVTMPDIGRHVNGAQWVVYLAGAMVLCAISIVGDLFESALKRQAGVKDSGLLLPGHGGVLDRIDSATAVLPAGALMLAWMGAA